MGRRKPLAYLHRRKDEWVVTCVLRIEHRVRAKSRIEAMELDYGIGWDVRRYHLIIHHLFLIHQMNFQRLTGYFPHSR